jgi:hypothetical protein
LGCCLPVVLGDAESEIAPIAHLLAFHLFLMMESVALLPDLMFSIMIAAWQIACVIDDSAFGFSLACFDYLSGKCFVTDATRPCDTD